MKREIRKDNPVDTSVGWPLQSRFLQPLGLLYLGLCRLRAALLSKRDPIDLGRPTISIGNLTFGGTGKTPATIELARILIGKGLRPAVILRGYRRETRGAIRVRPSSSWREVGDEALVIASNLPDAEIAVAEKREDAARLVVEKADLMLLDDGFQHVRVRRDINLLLVDATRPNDLHAPPAGRLRESLRATGRADAILVTRGSPSDLPEALIPYVKDKPIIGVRFEWGKAAQNGSDDLSWNELTAKRAFAFAGIGNPSAFFAQAASKGIQIVGRITFEDHAEPDTSKLNVLLEEAAALGVDFFLTTEKDAVKWLSIWPDKVPLIFPKLRASFEDPDGAFDRLLASITGGI